LSCYKFEFYYLINIMKKNLKAAIFWLIGSLLIFLGAVFAGKIEMKIGVDYISLLIAILVSLFLIMLGGLFWICVAGSRKSILR